MPVGTVNREPVGPFPLEKLPDGFVTIVKMSYGETLKVGQMQAKMRARSRQEGMEVEMETLLTQAYIFKRCVVDHNIEKEDGSKFDLGNVNDLMNLDPAVGAEVEELVSKLNDSEDMAPFLGQSMTPSDSGKPSPQKTENSST
jgi:hypothetical protein